MTDVEQPRDDGKPKITPEIIKEWYTELRLGELGKDLADAQYFLTQHAEPRDNYPPGALRHWVAQARQNLYGEFAITVDDTSEANLSELHENLRYAADNLRGPLGETREGLKEFFPDTEWKNAEKMLDTVQQFVNFCRDKQKTLKDVLSADKGLPDFQ